MAREVYRDKEMSRTNLPGVKRNRGGKPVEAHVWINGDSVILYPDSELTPVQGQYQKGQGQLL